MSHIVEIEDDIILQNVEKEKSRRKITHALEISIFAQFSFGFMVSLMGLSGLPVDLIFAGEMFGLGLCQTFSALPGMLAIKYKCKETWIWIGYSFLQTLISLCQLSWFIICISLTPVPGWLAALYFCLFAFQMWCAIASVLHTNITSFPVLISELQGKPNDSSSSSPKSVKKSKSKTKASSKKKGSTNSSIKSKNEKKKASKSKDKKKKKQPVKAEKKASSVNKESSVSTNPWD
uniref:Uncharacterized protein n=1 Tax=Panagrolaimus sp. ES5 TaxID=591445 RepID=A0AC34GSB6_9BILA